MNETLRDLQVQWVHPDKLKPYERNARTHNDEQIEQIARSLDEFGWTNPILTDAGLGIIAGHGRWMAARKRQREIVPYIVLDGLTDEQRRAYIIADNKLALNSGWNSELLALELGELGSANFDLSFTGFASYELTNLLSPPPEAPTPASLWEGMPEFEQNDLWPEAMLKVFFRTDEDRVKFLALIGESPDRTKYVWYPPLARAPHARIDRTAAEPVPPNRYPIYVISKGRSEKRLTMNALEQLGLPYHAVVEPQEADAYAAHVDREKILVLPFSNLGQGSIPARNWVWEHSISIGAKRHWILDDNMDGFYRLLKNKKTRVRDINPFAPIEDMADRYENVALAGMQYEFFCPAKAVWPPFYLNTRVYSCILIDNALPYRWRGRYNEDTDLSLRALKDGLCTILFCAFLAKKMRTMTMKGGNTDELYKGDGRLKMAQSLVDQHPDVVTVSHKWGRAQHHVDYRPFRRNVLRPRAGVEIPAEDAIVEAAEQSGGEA